MVFNFSQPLGASIGQGITLTPEQQMAQWLNAMNLYEASPLGQRQNTQQQAANETLYNQAQAAIDAKKRELDNQRAQTAIQRGQAQADAEYKQGLIAIQHDQLALDERKRQDQVSQFAQTFGEGQRQFDVGQGFNALSLGAQLSQSPADLFKDLWYRSGTAGDPNVNANVARWANAYGPQHAYTGAYSGTPQAGSVANLAASLTGGAGASTDTVAGGAPAAGQATNMQSPGVQATLGALRQFGMNPTGASSGFWESKKPSEQAAILAGLGASGFDATGAKQVYDTTRLASQLPSAWAA